MENSRIADILDEIADLLDLEEANEFRVRSYRNAAQTVRGLSERVEDMIADGKHLSDLPNIGKSTGKKLHEIVDKGTCKRLEQLRAEIPEGVTRVMDVPELGPRSAMQLHRELGIESLDELRRACEDHRVRKLEGFGEKTEANILEGIDLLQQTAGRILYHEADEQLSRLGEHLDNLSSVDRWEATGSYRRGKETVGDLDILIHAKNRPQAADEILGTEQVADIINRGEERMSVRLTSGLQVDFRFFELNTFGSALLYFTGSKAHNIRVRRKAIEHGWKLNEYGLLSGDKLLAGRNEKAIYHKLKLPWIPPELREDRGEIAAGENDALPELIELDDIRGDLQCHTTASDGKHSIRDMARAARQFGYQFLAITDHSKRVTMANGLDDDETLRHAEAIREVDAEMEDFRLLAGIEVDVLKGGSLDLSPQTLRQLDWVVASIHYDRNLDQTKMTDRYVAAAESGVVHTIGHPFGRIIGKRDAIALDMDRVIQACLDNNVCLEINAQPDRLDLPDVHVQHAREAGVLFSMGTDAHASGNFPFMRFGVNVARRGWLSANNVINTFNTERLMMTIS